MTNSNGQNDEKRGRNRATALVCLGVVVGMVGMAYAAVPLYDIVCRVTGWGGTTQTADILPDTILDRVMTVRFDSNVSKDIPWRFKPVKREMDLKVGEQGLAFFEATNQSDEYILGTATFNVAPLKAGQYFTKIDCFCFTEQILAPGETVDMPVTFFVDPEIANDRNLDEVTTITLSYTFFRVDDPEALAEAQEEYEARTRAQTASLNADG